MPHITPKAEGWLEAMPVMEPAHCVPVLVAIDGEWREDICIGCRGGMVELVEHKDTPVDLVRINLDHPGGMGFALQEWVERSDGEALTATEWSDLDYRWVMRGTIEADKMQLAKALGAAEARHAAPPDTAAALIRALASEATPHSWPPDSSPLANAWDAAEWAGWGPEFAAGFLGHLRQGPWLEEGPIGEAITAWRAAGMPEVGAS